jgi:hypothetical protein
MTIDACASGRGDPAHHFVATDEMVRIGSGAERVPEYERRMILEDAR